MNDQWIVQSAEQTHTAIRTGYHLKLDSTTWGVSNELPDEINKFPTRVATLIFESQRSHVVWPRRFSGTAKAAEPAGAALK